MTTELIIGLGILLMIVGYYLYKNSTSKFNWQKEADHIYRLTSGIYSAKIMIGSSISLLTYKDHVLTFTVNHCPSIKWAKDKAEQVIEEDEKKQEEEHWDD